jgi:hypothetical protein
VSSKPTAPTLPEGSVEIVASKGTPGFGFPLPGHRFTGTLRTALTLDHRPKATNSAVALLYLISGPGTYTVTASYVPTSNHKASSSGAPFVVRELVGPSLKSQLLVDGAALQELGTYEQGVGGAILLSGGGGAIKNPTPAAIALVVGGGATGAWGAITSAIGQAELRLASFLNDPPDRSYLTVPVAHVPRTPNVPAGNSPVLRTVRKLLANANAFVAITPVVGIAINRAATAGKAGDVRARAKQVRAATADLTRLAGILRSEISLQRKVAVLLARAHIGKITLHRSRAGLPATAARILKLLRLRPAQIAKIRKEVAAQRLPASIRVASLFVNKRLISAEQKEEAALLKFAADPAPEAFVGLPAVYP